MKNFLSLFFFISLFTNCQLIGNGEPENALARVGDNYLYRSDLDHISFSDTEDSLIKAKSFIEAWINKQLLLEKALQNLSEKQADFSDQLENYKNSLLIYAYENQLIKQKLDTLVSEKEIRQYYQENKHNFKLKEQLFQLRFVKYLNSAPIQDSLKFWLYADEDYKDKLMDYCTQFAEQCHLDTNEWVSLTNIKRLMPDPEKNILSLINSQQSKFEASDTIRSFIANIDATKPRDMAAPISYIKNQIIEIIINKRKLQLLSKVKQEIYEEATLKRYYELYE